MRVLVLDDQPERFASWPHADIVASPDACIGYIETVARGGGRIDLLSLDFDLGESEGRLIDATPVVDFLCESAFHGRDLGINRVEVHSMNAAAVPGMIRSLERYGYNVHRSYLPGAVLLG